MNTKRRWLEATSLGCTLALIPAAGSAEDEAISTVSVAGATRVDDYLNSLPQFVPAQGAYTLPADTAQTDLRGLDPRRTLVLINGRRLAYGSSLSAPPDLNQIPMALVERVDMLTGGASAVYGSDAIAGVVDFVLYKNFDGFRIDGQLSAFQHSNDNDDALAILGARGFDAPDQNAFDGEGADVNLIAGINTSDGRGNVTAYAGYRTNSGVEQEARDYSACAYNGGAFTTARPFGFACAVSAATPNGFFFTPSGTFTLDESGAGDTFRPVVPTDLYNLAAVRSLLRRDERYVFGGFAHYEFSRHFDLYNETMFYDYETDAQNSHAFANSATSSINCDNPFLSPQQGAIICGPAFGSPGFASLYPSKRFVEGPPRLDRFRNKQLRIVGGVRGDIVSGWSYDAYFQYSDGDDRRRFENDISLTRFASAIDVIDVGGAPACRSADPACVPLNLFQIGGVTPEALDYLTVSAMAAGDVKQYVASGYVAGNLGPLSPWSDQDAGVAAGFEWRKDSLAFIPDALFQSGGLAGQGGVTPPLAGSLQTRDFFFEANVPFVSDRRFMERLSVNAGFRRINPSRGESYLTWKLTSDWELSKHLHLRGGWQRAGRTPNILDLFAPQSAGLTFLSTSFGFGDPCVGPVPTATFAQCQNTGVSLLPTPSSPTGQYNATFGGDPALQREKSDSWTIGGVFSVTNFLVTVDYFDISVDHAVSAPSPSLTLEQCLITGDPIFCNRIHRDSAGTLWQTGFIEATNVNLGRLSTTGLDIAANWIVPAGDAGAFQFEFVSTLMFDLKTLEIPDQPSLEYDCAGLYASSCGSPKPKYRHKLTATWETPSGVDASIGWRKISSVDQFGVAAPDPAADRNHRLDGRNYVDLALAYEPTRELRLTLGVNNVLDKDPPRTAVPGELANGNTFPQTYDPLGRYLYLGATLDLW